MIIIAIIIFNDSYSALKERIVVIDPAPAIIGKAKGTIDAVFGVASSLLNIFIPRTISKAIANKTVTYDLARVRVGMQTLVKKHESSQEIVKELEELMPGATLVTCSGFGDAIVDCM